MKSTKKDIFCGGKKLPLFDEFYTLQGEGFHTGKAAYFIRLGGCDIGCRWCDSKAAWNAEFHQLIEIEKIVKNAMKYPAKAVVVTGGEPLTYNLDHLCDLLRKNNIRTFLETSGAYPLTGSWDWICLSPKLQSPPRAAIFEKANELKVIIEKEEDFLWAEENSTNVLPSCKLLLQPEWSSYNKMIKPIVEYIKKNPCWNISIQAHKFMRIP